jgi:alkylation response protein AidB-like acyl-CoA dehydrogenase
MSMYSAASKTTVLAQSAEEGAAFAGSPLHLSSLFLANGPAVFASLRGSASESNIVKLTVTNNAVAVVEDALSLTGNHGLTRANPLERH